MTEAAARAIVTGTSSGIGMAVAQRLLAGGWAVDGVDLAAPRIAHERFRPFGADLADTAQCTQAVRAALEQGAPRAFVHAAGMLYAAPLGQLEAGHGLRMWQVHVDAASRIADAVVPTMVAARQGRGVLIGSRVLRGVAGRSQYAACKAALTALARSWAAEVVASGVTVNVVSPGATDTPMLQDPARTGSAPRVPPIGRLIRPEEVAAMVGFLLSGEAGAITGQDIAVCGGASLDRGNG